MVPTPDEHGGPPSARGGAGRLALRRRSASVAAWVVLALGVLASVGGALWWQGQKADEANAGFDRSVAGVEASVRSELQRYVEALAAARALLTVAGGLDADGFDRYVTRLDLRRSYPSADGLAVIARRSGPAQVATLVAPPARWVSAGFDFSAFPPVHAALERSARTGAPVLSERFTPFADAALPAAAKHDGFVAVLPLGGRGWVAVHFRGDRFLAGVLGRTGFAARLELFDGPDPATAKRLAGTAVETPVASGPDALLRVRPLEVLGRRWTLRAAALPELSGATDESGPWLVLLGGLMVTGLLFAVLRVLAGQKARVDRQVEATTRDLRASEGRFRSLAASSPIGIFQAEATGAVLWVNDELVEITGQDASASLGDGWRTLVHPDDGDRLRAELTGLGERGELSLQLRLQRGDGQERWVHVRIAPVDALAGPDGGLVGNVEDITERRAFEAELEHNALHDALTGLPNRALFADRVGVALARSARAEHRVGVLFVDLDRFKVVNDSLGHSRGDALLVAVGERLVRSVRLGDTVARFGGDEFTVLCDGLTDGRRAVEVAERILAALAEPVRVDGVELHATASIGIAYADSATATAEALVRDADAAMYRAKQLGKSRVEIFDDALRASATEHLDVENGLRRAIERDELVLLYQPKVDLRSGEVVGVEALVRWDRAGVGRVAPAAFIPIAEETGLVVGMGAWVLREACRQAAEWATSWPGPLPPMVAVNLSARQLADAGIVALVVEVLAATRLPPRRLCLEITESTLMDDAEAAAVTLAQLRSLGVRLAIDDFGTGYSSLSYLQRFPVDFLKVDRSFVSPLRPGGGEETAIVEAITGLGHALGLEIIAEGVETDEQRRIVTRLGCALGQGFLWSPPVSAGEVEALAAGASRPAVPAAVPA